MKQNTGIWKLKCKAFTLMEMLVVLVLISIVFSAGALLYIRFNRYLENQISQNDTENEVLLFTRALKNDLLFTELTEAGSYEIIIRKTAQNSITYTFTEEHIIRKTTEVSDTFWIATQNIVMDTDPLTSKFKSVSAELILENSVFPILVVKEPENVELFNSAGL